MLAESAHGCLFLSFAGVRMMDASFADEVFAALASARGRPATPARCLVLQDLDATSCDNLNLAMLSRPTREPGLRNCVLPVLTSGRIELVGKTEDHVRLTFE